ncbi:hypothetical protein [Pedobacter jamesrossensis]|uniref:Uncharacterized protein n=1 Tax=Pedobacter jamesrossensis TaxID=1908238 RepID=A0ABV8NQA1_9SPHI
MNTKILMIASCILFAIMGVTCSFLPAEILTFLKLGNPEALVLIVQVLGALNFGFAILNWTAKANLIGGIYSKPVSLGNSMHFFMVFIILIKYFLKHTEFTMMIIPIAIYGFFAIAFGLVSFGQHEFKKGST